jgi:hypothetical protein
MVLCGWLRELLGFSRREVEETQADVASIARLLGEFDEVDVTFTAPPRSTSPAVPPDAGRQRQGEQQDSLDSADKAEVHRVVQQLRDAEQCLEISVGPGGTWSSYTILDAVALSEREMFDVAVRPLCFEPLLYQNDLFAKTGSGQT